MSGKPKVIAIAAVSGGGKTTITQEVRNELKNAEALFFDDYEFEHAPSDLVVWVKEGPDYEQWNLAPLISDIERLLTQESLSYLLLDYPFSYRNKSMQSLIDFSIYIDTPLDIAMARRLLRDYPGEFHSDLHNDMKFYLESGRMAYLEMEKTIKSNADFIVDGTLPVQEIIERIVFEVKEKEW